jgi:hypothetical protein
MQTQLNLPWYSQRRYAEVIVREASQGELDAMTEWHRYAYGKGFSIVYNDIEKSFMVLSEGMNIKTGCVLLHKQMQGEIK